MPSDLQSGSSTQGSAKGRFGYVLVLVYLFIEYGRPQDLLPFMGTIHIGRILDILLILSLFTHGQLRVLYHHRQTKMVWLFIMLLIALVPFARNNFWAYEQTVVVLSYVPFYLSTIAFVNTLGRLKGFVNCWIFLMIYLSISGIGGKGVAGSSFLADENDFSLLMNMMIPFGYFCLMYEKDWRKKILYLSASLLAVLGVVVSFSRGGFVGLVAVFAFIWLVSSRKILSLFLLGVIGVGVMLYSDNSYWAEMETVANPEESTARERLDSWAAGWNMFVDNPLGVGPNNFPIRFPDYQLEGRHQKNMWGRRAHSLWFTLLPELGIFGVLVYFSLLISNVRDLIWVRGQMVDREDVVYCRLISLALLASLVGYFTSGTFLSVLYYPHYFYMTAIVVVTRSLAEQKIRGL